VWVADVLPKLDSGAVVPDPYQGLREMLWVYRLADFERLHSHMTRLWWNMFHFNGYLRDPKNPRRVAEFRMLLS
jgi:hypothetical protein